jgi:Tol biopolymer transport system component
VHDRQTGATTRVSVASDGTEGNSASWVSSISANGRFVVFRSASSNLVIEDTNDVYDIFVHDLHTGETTRVSVASDGSQSNGHSWTPVISADGRYIAFDSSATNLVPGDTNEVIDVFVHDRQTKQTTRISISSDGEQGNGNSHGPSISGDGVYIAFGSYASNLVAGDTNEEYDVFVHNQLTGETTRISVSSGGVQGNAISHSPSISSDGHYVAFASSASNLVPDDANGYKDVFVRDLHTGETMLLSSASDGTSGNGDSGTPSISADGLYISFYSEANNLVPSDMNGASDIFVHNRGSALCVLYDYGTSYRY